MTKRLSTEEFIERVICKHEQKYNYSLIDYVNAHKKVTIICPKHGKFEQSPNKHLRGQNCPKCVGLQKLTTDEFIIRAKKVHGNKYNYFLTKYISIHKKVKIICPIHGEFEQEANSHLYGSGCPRCNKKNSYIVNNEIINKYKIKFIKNANKIHNNKYYYSLVEYKNNNTKVKIICKEHGIFEQSPNAHLQKRGCPKCSNHVSKPEKEICSFLDSLNIDYKQSNRSIIKPYELDIVVPLKKLAIEFNGRYYHSNKMILKRTNGKMNAQEYHQMKTDMCNEKGYKLLHIFEQDWIDNKEKELNRIIKYF